MTKRKNLKKKNETAMLKLDVLESQVSGLTALRQANTGFFWRKRKEAEDDRVARVSKSKE